VCSNQWGWECTYESEAYS